MIKYILLGILLLLIVIVVAIVKLLPLPYALAVLLLGTVILVVGIPWLIKRLVGGFFKRAITGVMGAKSKVLRNATAQVHNVTITDRPTHLDDVYDDEADEEATPPADLIFYKVDLTITPDSNQESPFAMWEPGDLVLISYAEPAVSAEDFASLAHLDEDDDEDEDKEIESYQVMDVAFPEGSPSRPSEEEVRAADDQAADELEYDEEDDTDNVRGPQRVLLTFGIPKSAPRELKFRYYFDDFGKVTLP